MRLAACLVIRVVNNSKRVNVMGWFIFMTRHGLPPRDATGLQKRYFQPYTVG